MAKITIPAWWAREHNFPLSEGSAIQRTFFKLSRLYNEKDIHIGMCFDYDTGMNSRFQFEFDKGQVSLTEEGRNDQIWVADVSTLEVEVPDHPGEFIEVGRLSTDEAKVQAILNCLGNAFDNSPKSDASFEESQTYEMMDTIMTFVPGSPSVAAKFTDQALLNTQAAAQNFDGSINGTKTVVCKKGSEIIQTLTGTARIVVDRSLKDGSVFDWINSLKNNPEISVPDDVAKMTEDFTNDTYLLSVVSRKNDGEVPGGTLGRIDFQDVDGKRSMKSIGGKQIKRLGDDSDTDIAELFKAIFGEAIEYQPLAGSGDAAGIPGNNGLDYVHTTDTSSLTGKGTEKDPLAVRLATVSATGAVRPDGVTLAIGLNGVLSVVGGGGSGSLLEVEEPIVDISQVLLKYQGDVSGVVAYISSPQVVQEVSFDGDYDPITKITTFAFDVSSAFGSVAEVTVTLRLETGVLRVYRSSDKKLRSTMGVIYIDGDKSVSRVPGEIFLHTEEELIEGMGVGDLVTATSNGEKTNQLVQINDIQKRIAYEINEVTGDNDIEKTYYDYTLYVVCGQSEKIKEIVTSVTTYKFVGVSSPRLGQRVEIVDENLEGDKVYPDNAWIRVSKDVKDEDGAVIGNIDYLCLTEKTDDGFFGTVISIDGGDGGSGGGDLSDIEARLKKIEDAITIVS